MSAPDLTTTLLSCQSPDPNVRQGAEAALASAEQQDPSGFLLALATELATEAKDITARQLAGLHFKNMLVAKDDDLQAQKHARWKAFPPNVRGPIKEVLLSAIRGTVVTARHTAAQACAEIAAVELPANEWPEVLQTLMENVTTAGIEDGIKISSLECLGFTCERISTLDMDGGADGAPEIQPETTDRMLTTIVDGIRKDRPDAIRLAAAQALRNSLAFTRKNMESAEERNMIMQTVCEATQSADVRVRTAAYECLVQIAFLYYNKLQDYMQTLFQLTFATIPQDEEVVALQALEFWSTLCEEEMELIDEAAELAEQGLEPEPDRRCVGYVKAALEHLCPLLMETLCKQDEDLDLDDDQWNISMSGSTCLTLVATTVEDAVVPAVVPFVQQHIQSDNWRYKEAATMAFSSILEGPSAEAIGPYVNQSIPVLLRALNDPNDLVKDTTSWTLGRICQLHVQAIPVEHFPILVKGFAGNFTAESPRVATQACFGIHNLAMAFADEDQKFTTESTGKNALTPFVPDLLQALLNVVDREDASESNLRVGAFEAISVLIQTSGVESLQVLLLLLPAIIDRLNTSFDLPALTNEEKEHKEGVQGLLCGLIQVIALKTETAALLPYCDSIMTNLLRVLQTRNATCHEEALSATSAIADRLEKDFVKYLPALMPFLMLGLRNYEAYQVCTIAVGLVGDICRSVEADVQPYCNDIMSALMECLQNSDLHRDVKPPVLSCFGDVAMAIGAGFEPYLQVSLMMLMQASQTTVPADDEELADYIGGLREGILEAYTGIVQGLKDGQRTDLLLAPTYIDAIMAFLEMLAGEMAVSTDGASRDVLGKAVGLVGDLASALGGHVKVQVAQPFVAQLLLEGSKTGDQTIIDTCTWANGVVQQCIRAV